MTESLHPFETVGEILDVVRRLHLASLTRFEFAAATCADHRGRALFSYLRQREAEQIAAISRWHHFDNAVLGCVVQSVPAGAMDAALHDCDAETDDIDDVIARYRHRDAALTNVYRQIAANVGPRARILFDDLADARIRNQARLTEALLDF